MELTHDFTVPAPIEQAWATFMDLERVGSCFPGATVTSVEGDSFSGTVKVKLGPIALQYNGSGQFVERDDANHRAVLEAKGKDRRGNGTAGANVTVHMTPGTDETRIDVTTDLSITGKPAQFGRGVMQDVSDKLLQQFITCIEQELTAGGAPAEPTPEPADEAPAPPDATDGAAAEAGAAKAADLTTPTASEPSASPTGTTETDTTEASGTAAAAAAGGVAAGTTTASPSAAAAAESGPGVSPPVARPATPRPVPVQDDALDLGATVLPVVLRSYAPHLLAGLTGFVLGLLVRRRRRIRSVEIED